MKPELMALLMGAPGVVARTPGGINWALHPEDADEAYIVLSQIGKTPGRSNTARVHPTHYRVQIDCYALTALEVEQMSRAVEAAIDGHHGASFPGIFLIGATDMLDGDENQPIHRVSMDFTIVYRG